MNGLFFLICSAFVTAATAGADWTAAHRPLGRVSSFRELPGGSVLALPANDVSRDGGEAWTMREGTVPDPESDFVDELRGMSVSEGIYLTTDGGKEWKKVFGDEERLPQVARFFDRSRGFATGEGRFWRTEDGGASWTPLEQPRFALGAEPRVVYVLDPRRAWAAGSDRGTASVFSTEDAGRSWSSIGAVFGGRPRALAFAGRKRGWLLLRGFDERGARGVLARTADGGRSWAAVALSTGTAGRLTALAFKDEREGWAAGPGVLLHTTDAGATWVEEPGPPTAGAEEIALFYGRAKGGAYLLVSSTRLPEDEEPGARRWSGETVIYRRAVE
jgi:photosystem II stability/assembly factor-like uncharacterized protein